MINIPICFPRDWYWLKQDGTVYSSRRQREYAASDADYNAWLAAGNLPTAYPKDLAGADSEADLSAVLAAYGMAVWAPDAKIAAVERLTASCAAAITAGFTSAALGAAHTYPSKQTDQINLMGSVTDSLLPDLPVDWSTAFWCADADGAWGFRPHSASQIQRAGRDGKAHVLACQYALQQLSAAVMAATSVEAVQALAWPVQGDDYDAAT